MSSKRLLEFLSIVLPSQNGPESMRLISLSWYQHCRTQQLTELEKLALERLPLQDSTPVSCEQWRRFDNSFLIVIAVSKHAI